MGKKNRGKQSNDDFFSSLAADAEVKAKELTPEEEEALAAKEQAAAEKKEAQKLKAAEEKRAKAANAERARLAMEARMVLRQGGTAF